MKEKNTKYKIGILGGTFNPIHIGHLILAQNALEYLKLDKVLIMPSGVSYLKDPKEIVATEHRINMTALSIQNNPAFELSLVETQRRGNSYTYETLEELSSNNPQNDYYLIFASDVLFSITTWKHPELIFDKCTAVCAKRNGHTGEELKAQSCYLKDRFNAKIILMDYDEIDISSSMIRSMLKDGKSCKYYLDDKVIDYISRNKLYIDVAKDQINVS